MPRETAAARIHECASSRSPLGESARRPRESARFDRFTVTASTERVGWWTERRLHHRASLGELSDAERDRRRPHTRVCELSFTSRRERSMPARERSFRPFHCDGVDRARRLVDRATVPPPDIIFRALGCQDTRSPPVFTRFQARLCSRIKNTAYHETALEVTKF